jgi:hypothetical protein
VLPPFSDAYAASTEEAGATVSGSQRAHRETIDAVSDSLMNIRAARARGVGEE